MCPQDQHAKATSTTVPSPPGLAQAHVEPCMLNTVRTCHIHCMHTWVYACSYHNRPCTLTCHFQRMHMSLPAHAREHPCTCACASMHTEAMLTQLCVPQIESSIESLTTCHPACMHESTCRFISQFMYTCVQDLIPVDDDDEILATMLKQAVREQ